MTTETTFEVGERVQCDGLLGTVTEIKSTAIGVQYVVVFDEASGLAARGVGVYADCAAPYTLEAVSAEDDPHTSGLIRPWDHP